MAEAADQPAVASGSEEPFLESSGGVIFRQKNGQIQVAVVQTQRGAWVLPKGAVEPGEAPKDAAVREVLEETGIVGEVVDDLGEIRYEVRPDLWTGFVPKVVHQYLLRSTGGSIRPDPAEHVEARWVAMQDAVRMLHHVNERTIMLRAEDLLSRQNPENVGA